MPVTADVRLHDTSYPSSRFGEELCCERQNVSHVDTVSILQMILWFFQMFRRHWIVRLVSHCA